MIKKMILICVLLSSLSNSIETIEELDELSVFKFAVFSDNKSRSPNDDKEMELAAKWIEQSNTDFLVGVGDHVKRGRNDFERFIENSSTPVLWKEHFYPNVADGENEYWGSGQGDYGAGQEILNLVNMDGNPNLIEMRNNKSEYYAKIPVKGFNVHIIQLHYSDSGPGLKDDSKVWMADVLNSIDKGNKDIIIVNGHSTGGNFPENGRLSNSQKDILFSKADFIFSATNHRYDRKTTSLGNKGALSMNSGAIGEGVTGHEGGFSQIHVLENPIRFVYQFQVVGGGGNARKQSERELHRNERSIDGASFVYCIEAGAINESCDWGSMEIPVSIKKLKEFRIENLKLLSTERVKRKIEFFTAVKAKVNLSLFNSEGKLIQKLYDGIAEPGRHSIPVGAYSLQPGVYFIRGAAGPNKLIKKISLIR